MPLAPGTALGPYQVLAPLGAGAMGEVYRARDTRLGRQVAIKVLPERFAADPERLRRFEQEARAVGALNHPNIVTLYDVGHGEPGPFLVTELLEGASLRERLQGGPLPPATALDIAARIADGLAAAHVHGVVHRDLKPENVFLAAGERVKILDFGIAKLVRAEHAVMPAAMSGTATVTEGYALTGTAGYMSPEQVRGEAPVPATDLFALGLMTYEMLTGRNPLAREAVVDTLHAILHDAPPPLPEEIARALPALERVLRRCVAKALAERFESARDLAFALRLAATDEGQTATAPAPAERASALETPLRRVTYRRGTISAARFGPDGKSIVLSAYWEGRPLEVFWVSAGSDEARPLALGNTDLLSVSRFGELAISLERRSLGAFIRQGTLARVPLGGRAPRTLLRDVQYADWTPDATSMAVVREAEGMSRLEYPPDRPLHQTAGWISNLRFSPDGKHIAFLDHELRGNDAGAVKLTDLEGNVRTLSTGWMSIWGIAWSPDGREVWFTGGQEQLRALQAVTLDGRCRMVFRPLGSCILHDISANGDVLLAHGQDRMGIQVIREEEAVPRDLSWLDWSLLRDLSPDGSTILFDETGVGGGEEGIVFVRGTDGTPATRLGPGGAFALSPDGNFVMSLPEYPGSRITLLPTGLGNPRVIDLGGIRVQWGRWCPDGAGIILTGYAPGEGVRLHYLDLATGRTRPVTPEGVGMFEVAVTPDSRWVAAPDVENVYRLYPLQEDAPARPLRGTLPLDRPVSMSADGRSLFVVQRGEVPARLTLVDLESGERTFVREVAPADRSGIIFVGPVRMSADARTVAFSYWTSTNDLFVFDGLARP